MPTPTTAPTTVASTQATPEPVPLLSAEEAIATFNLPPGLRAEVVAAEPMVQQPVAMTFDPDGRVWVVEMRSYMQDFAGANEDEPDGRISILEDTDGDGRMDKSTVFLEGLVLPRAIGLVADGALVAVPPNLLFCRDTDGDGKSDQQTIVASDYSNGVNPEHQANGLIYGIDNWIYSAAHHKRYRFTGGKWLSDFVPEMGQWGISQDDWGRLLFNTNSNHLRGNFVPPQYLTRNPHYPSGGVNVQIADDQEVFPAHDTAVNRGYLENFLREGGLLNRFTAACAPAVYRGDLLPAEYQGNAFTCEPVCNVIRRSILTEHEATLTARNAYEQKEFLASTYERFRPVNIYTGPEGALYIVDMHHGLLQHKQFLTPYATDQYLRRELHKHLMTGRIYRIVPDGVSAPRAPKLSQFTTPQLIECLSHPNGWRRDTAQRKLIERNDRSAIPSLKRLAQAARPGGATLPTPTRPTPHDSFDSDPRTRLHALWTLEGMRRIDSPTAIAALTDPHPKIRSTAIRLCEPLLMSPSRNHLLPHVLALVDDKSADVRLQFALTVSGLGDDRSDEAIARLLTESADHKYVRDAVLSGLRSRELELLQRLLEIASWTARADGREVVLNNLAHAILVEGSPRRVNRLLERIALQQPPMTWRRTAMLEGLADVVKTKRSKPLMLEDEPSAWASLNALEDERARELLATVSELLIWPGKPGYVAPAPPEPLTPAQQELFVKGQAVYAAVCIQCHKSDGLGQDGLAPPLAGSEWVTGDQGRLVRIILHGVRGPMTVNGKTWNLDMPNLSALGDVEIAAVATYARRSWDHTASAVEPELVRIIRESLKTRTHPWTAHELLLTHP